MDQLVDKMCCCKSSVRRSRHFRPEVKSCDVTRFIIWYLGSDDNHFHLGSLNYRTSSDADSVAEVSRVAS